MIDYIDAHRGEFGVEPICRVLAEAGVAIAPSSYYAHRARPPSPRSRRDERVKTEIIWVHAENFSVYGADKVWAALRREGGVDGRSVARCTVERLMRQLGLRGVVRGATGPRTTRTDDNAHRPADLVARQTKTCRFRLRPWSSCSRRCRPPPPARPGRTWPSPVDHERSGTSLWPSLLGAAGDAALSVWCTGSGGQRGGL